MQAPPASQALTMPSSGNPSNIKLWFNRIEDENEREALLRSLSKEEKHFQQAAYEIYVTELDYVEDLRIIIDVGTALTMFIAERVIQLFFFFLVGSSQQFVKPIQEKQILKPKNVEVLFSNVEILLGVNEVCWDSTFNLFQFIFVYFISFSVYFHFFVSVYFRYFVSLFLFILFYYVVSFM